MQIKTTIGYPFTPVRMAIIKKKIDTINTGECVEKREPSYAVGGNVNWCSYYGGSLKSYTIQLYHPPYDPAIPLLGIYPEKTLRLDTCTSVSIAALFTIAKVWKGPKWTEKRIIHTHTMEYYSAIKRNEIIPLQQHAWAYRLSR